MFHRTQGATRDCKGCRYWSEMIAQAQGGTVTALCLNGGGPRHGQYTAGYGRCDQWASGHLGAIDEPGQDPNVYREAA